MRISSLTVILIVAVLCFAAGYKLGQQKYTITQTEKPPVTDEAQQEEMAPEAVAQAEMGTTPIKPANEAAAPEIVSTPTAPLPSDADHAARAQQRFITLTDMQDRSLVAEILETKPDALKIRRQADGRIFQLPIEMLSPKDKAFAAYLQKQSKPEPTSQEDIDAIFDQLFN